MKKLVLLLFAMLVWASCDDNITEQRKLPEEGISAGKVLTVALTEEKNLGRALADAGFLPTSSGSVHTVTGLRIDTDNILKVRHDDDLRSNYTFAIANAPGRGFSNLVVEDRTDGYTMYLLRYESAEPFKGLATFTGTITRLNLMQEEMNVTELEAGRTLRSASPAGKVSQESQCVEEIRVYTFCEPVGGGGGPVYARTSGASEVCIDVIAIFVGPCPEEDPEFIPPGGGSGGTGGTGGGTSGGGTSGGGTSGGSGATGNCRCPGDGSGSTGGSGSSGGSNGSGNTGGNGGVGVIPEKIDNNVQNPCMRSMVEQALRKDLTNELSKKMHELFDGEDFNLEFNEDTNLDPLVPGDTELGTGDRENVPPTYFNLEIYLNLNTLPGATQEYIVQTIYHEIAHAIIIRLKGSKLTEAEQHELMVTDGYREMIKAALKEHFPTLSDEQAEHLSWGGLYDTSAYKAKFDDQKAPIEKSNKFHSQGKWGTKCPSGGGVH